MYKNVPNLVLLFGTFAVFFAVLEAAFRFAIPPMNQTNITEFPTTIFARQRTGGAGYELRRSSSATQKFVTNPRGYFDDGAKLTYSINKDGFRGPDVPLRKHDGGFRIIGLGDSFTFGTGVRNEDTFLSVFQRRLNEKYPALKIEALNFGVPGYDTADEIRLLVNKGIKYQPDLVVIFYFLNDAGGGGTVGEFNNAEQAKNRPFWRRLSHFLDYVAVLIDRSKAADVISKKYRESVSDDSKGWIEVQSSLKRAKKLSEQYDFNLLLVVFPVLWSLSDNYPFHDTHEKVEAFAKIHSIPVLELLPAFAGANGPELWVHPYDQHPNEIAHEMVGTFLAEKLIIGDDPSLIEIND